MRIGVIGAGDVGRHLAAKLASATGHHDVMIGTRDSRSEKISSWQKILTHPVAAGSFEDTARHGADLVIIATGWEFTLDVVRSIAPLLQGKVVVDVTNPLGTSPDGVFGIVVGTNTSGGELVQQHLPGAHVVKTLNTINFRHMVHPSFGPDGADQPTMFLCGNDQAAKGAVRRLLQSDFGWRDVVDMGDIRAARILEPLAMAWIQYAILNQTVSHGIKFIFTAKQP